METIKILWFILSVCILPFVVFFGTPILLISLYHYGEKKGLAMARVYLLLIGFGTCILGLVAVYGFGSVSCFVFWAISIATGKATESV
jgi:hypothetical protein